MVLGDWVVGIVVGDKYDNSFCSKAGIGCTTLLDVMGVFRGLNFQGLGW
jgi:hypothetical protein